MNIIKTSISGVVIIEPRIFNDDRGYFYESFSQREFENKVCKTVFIQDNESKSSYGVLRGLHFQKGKYSQSKLVSCVKGQVLDVAVDIRKGSPNFGKWTSCLLSAENHRRFFIPRGFAHGFSVLSDIAVFQYKCDNYYAPDQEGSIQWNDLALNIDWQISDDKIILSDKDRKHPLLKDCDCLFDYNTDLYK